jgi:AraC family transcriptional regulator
MEPRIEILPEKKLAGKQVRMSFSINKTGDLWRDFMPKRKEIKNAIGPELYSVEVYGPHFFSKFNSETEFEKWAAIEVTDFETVPEEMETITLPRGLYAVFLHKGASGEGPETYRHIFGTWLPESGFLLDNRPHFAIMGEKYKNGDPDSEEEIWIPVKPKENTNL